MTTKIWSREEINEKWPAARKALKELEKLTQLAQGTDQAEAISMALQLADNACSRNFEFEEGAMKPASEWKREGKPEWDHFLTIRLCRYRAGEMLKQLAGRFTDPNEKEEVLTFQFAGELKVLIDE